MNDAAPRTLRRPAAVHEAPDALRGTGPGATAIGAPAAGAPVALVADADGLGAIRRPGCAAAIWTRPAAPSFLPWLGALTPENLPRGRAVLTPDATRGEAAAMCRAAGTPAGPEREALLDDIAALARTFAAAMEARHLRLRLAPVDTDSCRRFHVDAIRARLVCTYRGPGTQYGVSTGGMDPAQVHQVATGAPALLRGTLWPADLGAPETRFVHRSPPIEGTGITRLVMVLDALDDPEDEA